MLPLVPMAIAHGQPNAEFSTLTVKVSGSGTVTSSPAGINCPSACRMTVATGTKVTLTATPSAGYAFSKWTGSCAGTSKTCAVLMTTNKTVNAWFVVKSPPPPPPPPGPPPPPPPPPPGKAQCTKNVACFDDLAPGVAVKKAYTKLGLELGYAVSNDTPGTTGAFPLVTVDSLARSGKQVGKIPPCSKEFCPPATIYGRFASVRRWVEVWVGGGAQVSLVGRNAKFAVIGGASKTIQTTSTGLSLLRVEAPSSNPIAYFQIGENAPVGSQRTGLVIDDLAGSPPDPNAKPDFALTWTPLLPGSPSLSVPMPGQVTTKVAVTRFGGSTGPIALSASSAGNAAIPGTSNVSVTVTPATATTTKTSSTTTVFVTLKATADAVIPAGSSVVVTGLPTSSAGTDARSATIPLDGRLSNFDFVVTGIEVTQGIQVQHTPYYSGSADPVACKILFGVGDECATLFAPSVCADLPSLPPRDMAEPSEPVHYTVNETAQAPQWLLDPVAAQPQQDGVALVAGRRTIVRVFASIFGPAGKSVAAPKLHLYGRRFNKQFTAGSAAESSPAVLRSSPNPFVTCEERADPTQAYTFTLPDSWTKGTIELRAELVPDDVIFGAGAECGSATCVANNTLTLDRIGFTNLGYTTITPVEAYLTGSPVPLTPGEVFDDARFFMPGRTFITGGSESQYAAVIVIDDIVVLLSNPFSPFFIEEKEERKDKICSAILDRLEDWGSENDRGDQTVAVIRSDDICNGVDGDPVLAADGESFEVVAANRSRNSVAHELFHGMGRLHADTACGGDSDGERGQSWPPEQRGHIHGIGLDWRESTTSGLLKSVLGPRYRIIAPDGVLKGDVAGQPDEWFDFMSYCATNGTSWISDRGWNDAVRMLRAFHKSRGRTTAVSSDAQVQYATPFLRVTAMEVGSQVAILDVGRASRGLRRGGPSPYRVVLRDAAGRVLREVAMRSFSVHDHGEDGESRLLKADVPAARGARLEIMREGSVLATRVRTSSAPRIRIVAPRAKARVGAQRVVVVRWTASDANKGPLRATVHYSMDAGKTWNTIATGTTRDRITLPSALFSGSKRARIRVTVSDGFNESSALSGIFTAVARKPTVRIVSPRRLQRFPGDTTLYLEGEAYDDRGTILRGKRLTWFDGTRRLGPGDRLRASGLRPGLRILRLRADDGRGGVANTFVRVRIVATRPHLLSLNAPAFVKRSARTVGLRIATTVPSKLQVGHQTFAVGPKAKAISVRVTPGRTRLELPLKLTAGSRSNTVTLVIRRR
jgi:Divergent InlB B-repeat domain